MKSWSSLEKGKAGFFLFSIGGFTFVAFKTYKMNDMSGKHGIVCMGLLMLLSSCHDDKQVTASGLQRKDFQTEVNGQYTDFIYFE